MDVETYDNLLEYCYARNYNMDTSYCKDLLDDLYKKGYSINDIMNDTKGEYIEEFISTKSKARVNIERDILLEWVSKRWNTDWMDKVIRGSDYAEKYVYDFYTHIQLAQEKYFNSKYQEALEDIYNGIEKLEIKI